ncbi:nickel-dependent hydrogenase, large subunit [Candidatus Koribacter versatilis Ellin345]|uniref:Nickel-dependent hydrogenase, large subunit n=1 Tax=Koribacter versatilis (strain Ellin345) TaxID=204669 RepID=Q1IIR0_KORVE|nr:nickel-dependent hydrogenase large subunit [Candidatus Koribacter versatilis]ABF43240.1 nickel-dependent hydrogenase, large subunit [Candidatus Koribacter versatilis Ellin345]
MAKRITIDPITRIEGHLRVDVQVDNNSVTNAWASCTMWRGIENILKGRDPRDAWLFTQRFCGVCTTVHAMASVRAVEDALKLEIPLNAQYIRNLILIAHALHDHIVHFYQLSALDWVDVMQIPKADPAATSKLAESLSPWFRNSRNELKQAQDRVNAVAASGQLGIFANGYWGHPAMRLSPEVNLLAFSHYMQALEYQRKALQIVGILGSKTPHIQNLTPGGVSNAIDLDSQSALNMERLEMIRGLFAEVSRFINEVYLVDVCAVASMYPEWFNIGSGVTNYLAVPDLPLDSRGSSYDLPGGYIGAGGLKSFQTASDDAFRKGVTEDVTHAYYSGDKPLHPWEGETNPQFTGWNGDEKYSWVKAPRFNGDPAQVGPLAQVLIGYTQGHALTKKYVGLAAEKVHAVSGIQLQPAMLHSTLGRHAARAIRAGMLAELAQKHLDLLTNNIAKGDYSVYNAPVFPSHEVEGVGTHEAPRGTLSHWIVIKDEKIKNYQAVVPSTWNASPRDQKNAHGPYEASLLHTPLARPQEPLEVLRTIHSFDPCMACACHTFDPSGNKIAAVNIL